MYESTKYPNNLEYFFELLTIHFFKHLHFNNIQNEVQQEIYN